MMDAIAERVEQGNGLNDADARTILDSHDLLAVGMLADSVRRRLHGTRTTFVRVWEIHVDAVPGSLPPNLQAGELRILGVPGSIDAAVAAVGAVAALAAGRPISGFSLADIKQLGGSSLEAVCATLRQAGLESIAEMPLDALDLGPEDVDAARRAGLAVPRITVTSLPDDERGRMAGRARDLQAAAGGFRAFAPLPRVTSVTAPSTGYADVKLVALARLTALNIDSIQVDWPLYGPKLAQVALTVGADDVDGIAAVETGLLGTRRSALEEIRGNVRAAALDPVERNGRWEVLGA